MLKRLPTVLRVILLMMITYGFVNLLYLKRQRAMSPKLDHVEKVHWVNQVEDALALSKKNGKAVLIDFWGDWCGPCHEMDRLVYGDEAIAKRLSKSFILVKMDTSSPTDYNIKWQTKFRISALPSAVFLDSNGKSLPKGSFTGFVDAQEMAKILDDVEAQLNENGQCVSC